MNIDTLQPRDLDALVAEKKQAEIDAASLRVLRHVLGKLPRTVDGTVMTPGMAVCYVHRAGVHSCVVEAEIEALVWERGKVVAYCFDAAADPLDFYESREAAEEDMRSALKAGGGVL